MTGGISVSAVSGELNPIRMEIRGVTEAYFYTEVHQDRLTHTHAHTVNMHRHDNTVHI